MVDRWRLKAMLLHALMENGPNTPGALYGAMKRKGICVQKARVTELLREAEHARLLHVVVDEADRRRRLYTEAPGRAVNVEWAAFGMVRDREEPLISLESSRAGSGFREHWTRIVTCLGSDAFYALADEAVHAEFDSQDVENIDSSLAESRARLKRAQSASKERDAAFVVKPTPFFARPHPPPIFRSFADNLPGRIRLGRKSGFVSLPSLGALDDTGVDLLRWPALSLAKLLREERLPSNWIIGKVGPVWTSNVCFTPLAREAKQVDHIVVQRNDPFTDFYPSAMRAAGYRVGPAEIEPLEFRDLVRALQDRSWAQLRAAFAVQPHLASAVRRLDGFVAAVRLAVIDPGVTLIKTTPFSGRLGYGMAGLESFVAEPLRAPHRREAIRDGVRDCLSRPPTQSVPGLRDVPLVGRNVRFLPPRVVGRVGVADAVDLHDTAPAN